MGKIVILDENTANKIAAGEVVERPASVVKELVENSLDAGAAAITVEIKNGGISLIKVMDNGSGMEEDDVGIAFERHATSKIRSADDIENISSMGFRGEALASIAAVSAVQLVTRTAVKDHGTSIEIQGGNVIDIKPTGCPVGTTISVRNLFYNTPARFKFLKKDTTEAGYISDVIMRIALGHPEVSFKLISNSSTILHTPGNNDCLSAIFSVFGKETAREVYEVTYADAKIKISGYAGKPEIARSNRNQQTLFINKRLIRSKLISSAIDEAYNTYLMKNKFAFAVLNLEINPILVDVNVHPSKMEVKFSNEQDIFRAVYNAVNGALLSSSQIRTVTPSAAGYKNPFILNHEKKFDVKYTQDALEINKPVIKEQPMEDGYGKEKTPTQVLNQTSYLKDSPVYKYDTNDTNNTNNESIVREIEPDNNRQILNDSRIIGQAFNTYILLQQNDELLLMDQHAAHERIMYEEIRGKYNNDIAIAQTLLSTFVIELTHNEIKFLEEEKEFFLKLGFDFEAFGNNSILLRSAPLNVNENVKDIFLELLDYIISNGKTERYIIANEALYRIACKAAIKANKKLNEMEIKELLEKLYLLENPFSCPHGRPSVIKISKYELEKMFKRIV